MTKIIKILVVFVFVLVLLSVVSSAVPMSVEISCSGCDRSDGETYYVQKNKQITFTAILIDSVGKVKYEWKKNGENVSTSRSYSFIFDKNSQYVLKVSDNLGYVTRNIGTVESSSPSQVSCVPAFVIKSTDSIVELAPGDIIYLEMELQRRHGCIGYLPKWESSNPDIKIYNPTSLLTEIEVSKDARTGWSAEITAKIYSENYRDPHTEQSITLAIVSNSKPKIVDVSYSAPYSYSYFNVGISEFTTGIYGNENNDFIIYYEIIVKKNETGRVVDKKYGPLKKGESMPLARMKAQERGKYVLEARIIDSHKLSSDVMRIEFEVKKGTTGEDIPPLLINDSFNCNQYEICKMDASKTEYYDRDVSSYAFYEGSTGLKNKDGYPCSGSVCNTIFTYPGKHLITVTDSYFRGKSFSKTVTVIVSSNLTARVSQQTPLPTVKETSAVQKETSVAPKETPINPEEVLRRSPTQKAEEFPTGAKPVPGMEAIIAIVSILAIARRMKN